MESWTKTKPKLKGECLILTATVWNEETDFTLFEISKVTFEYTWYWGIFKDGDEWGDYEDLIADLYLVIKKPKITSHGE